MEKTKKLTARKSISTLDCPALTTKRVDGNTTRQVDFAIQKLFEGYIVIVEDHAIRGLPDNSVRRAASMHLYERIRQRLRFEFKIDHRRDRIFAFDVGNSIIKTED